MNVLAPNKNSVLISLILFLALHLIKARLITHQKIRKEFRNILEYFIFADRYSFVEYLNFCVHRIG